MPLEDVSLISQIVAALAVVVSLIYAGLQFGVYAKATRETRLVAHATDMQQFRMAIAVNAEFARVYRDGLADMAKLESVDRWRFGAMMQMVTQNYVLIREFKDISEGMTESGWEYVATKPGYRQWWVKGRELYSGEVRAHIDDFLRFDPKGEVT